VIRALLTALGVVLVLDVVALVAHHPSAAVIQAPGRLRVVAADAARFVERTRQLRFRHRVRIVELDGSRFERQTRPTGPESSVAGNLSVLVALGLFDPHTDLAGAGRGISADVTGLYDPLDHRVVLRAGLDPYILRRTLVHELTHVLDDQHFGLIRGASTLAVDESLTTMRALAEGDAVWVERHELPVPSPPTPASTSSTAAAAVTTLPSALLAYVAYPYEAGYRFVDALHARGGSRLVDRAFRHPPTSSAEILQPELYPPDRPAVAIRKPRPDGQVIDRGVFGELLAYLTLRSASPGMAALDAAHGWTAGRYVVYLREGAVCVRATVAAIPALSVALLNGLRQWSARHTGATIDATGPEIELANCVPAPGLAGG
jgi:hypothetical protein